MEQNIVCFTPGKWEIYSHPRLGSACQSIIDQNVARPTTVQSPGDQHNELHPKCTLTETPLCAWRKPHHHAILCFHMQQDNKLKAQATSSKGDQTPIQEATARKGGENKYHQNWSWHLSTVAVCGLSAARKIYTFVFGKEVQNHFCKTWILLISSKRVWGMQWWICKDILQYWGNKLSRKTLGNP